MNFERKINKMISKLYAKDAFLLTRGLNVNERTITYRMGMYLQELLPDLDVDCEYNRMGKKENGRVFYTKGDYFAKKVALSGEQVSDEDDCGSRVFPDIIIHRRNTAKNLAIIEVKVAWKRGDKERNLLKLERYIEDLKYEEGYFILLSENRSDVKIKRFPETLTIKS